MSKKIALNFIYKGNETGAQMNRMLSSVAPYVDAIYATATWQEKGEATDVAKTFGAKISFFKWIKDFSAARNFAMSQVPDEYEYILWLDMDDVLEGGEIIRKLLESDKDAYFFMYNYQIDEKTGEIMIKHPRERIVRKRFYKWVGKLHETLIPQAHVDTLFVNELVVNHYPSEAEINTNIQRNLEILEQSYKEEGEKHDPRTEYYLGRAYFDAEKYEEATKLFLDYLKHSGWDEERAMTYNYIGEIYLLAEKYDEGIDMMLQAVKERPEFPTWFINLGVLYGKKEDWERALFYTRLGLQIDQPKTAMVTTPKSDKVRALETIYLSCLNKNLIKEAYAAAEKLVVLFPDKKELKDRRDAVRHIAHLGEIGKSLIDIVQELEELGETDKMEALITALPSTLHETLLVEKLRLQFMPPKKWPEKSIVYYCGRGFEKWDESNLSKGIGGSETAVIQLAEQWTKAGYQVTVFGDPHGEHTTKGVDWKPYWKWNPLDTFDTLILWRNESVLNAPITANRIFLDLHDVPMAMEYTEERLKKVTKIFVKSPYHRSLLPDVPDDKFVIIPNGIDLNMLPKPYKIRKWLYKGNST